VVRNFGPPENIKTEQDYAVPTVGEAEVLVSVKAAGVNPVDTYIRSGQYAQLPQLPYVPGGEGAGIVEKVGSGVENVAVGQRVWFARPTTGSCADFCSVPSDYVYDLPDKVSFNQGATLGIAYFTAYRALFSKAAAQAGQTVFIHGISGGVGLAAAQLAHSHGLRVYGTASSEQGIQLAKQNGTEQVFDHSEAGYVEQIREVHPDGFDIILEMLANKNLPNDLLLLANQGKIVVIGNRGTTQIDPRIIMQKEATIVGVMARAITTKEFQLMAERINGLLEFSISPVIGKEYSLENVAEAHRDVIEHQGAKGKLVINMELE